MQQPIFFGYLLRLFNKSSAHQASCNNGAHLANYFYQFINRAYGVVGGYGGLQKCLRLIIV
jgi:hypothetical protein